MQDHYYQLVKIFLLRTAGPYIGSRTTFLGNTGDVAYTPTTEVGVAMRDRRSGRVEDERGRWGQVASLRFSSSLIEPDVPISGIRLSD